MALCRPYHNHTADVRFSNNMTVRPQHERMNPIYASFVLAKTSIPAAPRFLMFLSLGMHQYVSPENGVRSKQPTLCVHTGQA